MFDYWREHKLDIKVCRIFNTYGPFMQFNDGRVISNFILQALRGESLTIYGDGLQTRSFCYVDDIVDALILFMNSNYHGPVNLGRVDEISILDIAEKIIELCDCKYHLTYLDLPVNDPKIRCPDLSLLKELINWESKVSLEEGLYKTIVWFKERLNNV
jgi:UDP-glucuronate decarboxylase